jgi:pyruvate,water dikinase
VTASILFPDQWRAAANAAGLDVGGKARNLARAAHAGFPVPAWFVITSDAFLDSAGPTRRAALAAAVLPDGRPCAAGDVRDASASTRRPLPDAAPHAACDGEPHDPADAAERVQRIVDSVELSPALRAQLETALASLCADGARVAVRSSASDEDGAQHSFAGQLESVLEVPATGEEVAARVRQVWRSGFSARILAYRREHGLTPLPRPPAVIVQRMVQARAAGVAFSADPISGRRGVAVVSAVRGLGERLVSGDADADTWRVDRRAIIVERRIVTADAPVLRDHEVLAVARLARDAAQRFGSPQDIEWAMEGERLLLLQARPITALAARADPDGSLTLWDNSNIVESYSGVTTPLTFSFASDVYGHVYRQFCRLMRVPADAIEAQDDVFRNMLGLLRGRLYYNLPNWYRVLALLPGYRVNRPFMEQMMGVREPLPAEVIAQIDRERERAATSRGRLSDALHLATTLLGLIAGYATLNRRVRAFTQLLDDALREPDPPLEDRRPDELAAHYRELRQRLLLKWDAPLVNDFFAMIFYGLLRSLVRAWCGDPYGTLQNDLIGGRGGMVSAEPAVRLHRLAQLAAGHPEFRDRLLTADLPEIEGALATVPEFRAEYDSYLARFGERTVNELKLESATLHDDPLPLLRAVGNLARQSASAGDQGDAGRGASAGRHGPVATHGDGLRREAQARVREALRTRIPRRLVFAWVLRQAQARVRDRENLRLERTRLFGRIRRIMREMGRRFRELGLLDDAADIFYLEVDEVLALVEGRSTCTDLRALAALRRREFDGYAALPAPDDRFETRGLVYHGHDFRHVSPAPASDSDSDSTQDARQGLGCCPGMVRGPVRVVLDPRGVTLAPGTILVAEHTDPGWILIFPAAAGLLVERGSLLSHAAIVARELGIPAVVSLTGLTRWLRDGDWVEIDGSSGHVRKIVAPVPATGSAHAE